MRLATVPSRVLVILVVFALAMAALSASVDQATARLSESDLIAVVGGGVVWGGGGDKVYFLVVFWKNCFGFFLWG